MNNLQNIQRPRISV